MGFKLQKCRIDRVTCTPAELDCFCRGKGGQGEMGFAESLSRRDDTLNRIAENCRNRARLSNRPLRRAT